MRHYIRCALFLALAILCSGAGARFATTTASAQSGGLQWYPGIVHVHTTFSDGSDNVPQRVKRAKDEVAKFLVITDHYEQVDCVDKAGHLGGAVGTDFGFEDYLRNCSEQTGADFVTIPGAEIASFWSPEPEQGNRAECHTLALGPVTRDPKLWELGKNPLIRSGLPEPWDKQPDIIERLNALAWLPVAAHPYHLATASSQWPPWEWQDNRYDRNNAGGIAGVEMFNSWGKDEDQGTVGWYLDLVRQGNQLFVTSGCDSHGWVLADPRGWAMAKAEDDERWERKTWVQADGLSVESIMDAFAHGRTYAAKDNTRLEGLNQPIGWERGPQGQKLPQRIDSLNIHFTVVFDEPLEKSTTVEIYRDGILAPDSVQQIAAGVSRFSYNWTDPSAARETPFTWIIFVRDKLITSPIWGRKQAAGGAGGGGRIAFVSDRDGKYHDRIYVMNPDGSGQIARTPYSDGSYQHPAWSADGTRIAFACYTAHGCYVYVMNADGTGMTRVVETLSFEVQVAWSPDGRRIAFLGCPIVHGTFSPAGRTGIYVMNANGGALTPLIHEEAFRLWPHLGAPVWSPDGTRIAFDSSGYDNNALYLVSAEGGAPRLLTRDYGYRGDLPAWSPDGTRIAFVGPRPAASAFATQGDWDIYVINADGTGQTNLTASRGDNHAPAWSPDGTRIAFVATHGAQPPDYATYRAVYVVNADGTGVTRVTRDLDLIHGRPVWSPDGTKIAFVSTRPGTPGFSARWDWDIYVINADGTGQRNLTGSPGDDYDPAWSPGGKPAPVTGKEIAWLTSTKISDVLANPAGYEGQLVSVEGSYVGRAEKYPVVPSDGIINDGTGQVAFSGATARAFRAEEDRGKRVKVSGIVRISTDGVPYIEERVTQPPPSEHSH